MSALLERKRQLMARRNAKPAVRPPNPEDNCQLVTDDLGIWVIHHCGALPKKQFFQSRRWSGWSR